MPGKMSSHLNRLVPLIGSVRGVIFPGLAESSEPLGTSVFFLYDVQSTHRCLDRRLRANVEKGEPGVGMAPRARVPRGWHVTKVVDQRVDRRGPEPP